MSKIYTKTGDKGTTGLFGGQRVLKSHVRIDTYGTVDELNSWIGALAAQQFATEQLHEPEISNLLSAIQRELFNIGSHLSTPYATGAAPGSLPTLTTAPITALETSIDTMTATLKPLREFILPGGSKLSSTAHITRTVCRRAERCIVALMQTESIDPLIIQYCNRLSDWLFTLARYYNAKLDVAEPTWK